MVKDAALLCMTVAARAAVAIVRADNVFIVRFMALSPV
jgi:hypothetical protein